MSPSRRDVRRGAAVAAATTAGVLGAGSAGWAGAAAEERDSTGGVTGSPAYALPDMHVGGDTGPRPTVARLVWQARTTEPLLALTFDDGPESPYTREYLDVLDELGVRATFNIVGARAKENLADVRRESARGHELGNHSWSHPDLSTLDERTVREQLERTDTLIRRVSGRGPAMLRPPFGHLSGITLRVAGEMGYDIALWSLEMHEKSQGPAANADYLAGHLVPGTVLLAHDGGGRQRRVGVAALPLFVRQARARGYEFVTMSELLAASSSDSRAAGSQSPR